MEKTSSSETQAAMMSTPAPVIEQLALRLQIAERERVPVAPISPELPSGDVRTAYLVQHQLSQLGIKAGRRIVGRKIGLTSRSVQSQLGVGQPDYGTLFADMAILDKDSAKLSELIEPRVEAEIAFVLDKDLVHEKVTLIDLMRSVQLVLPAIEIVDSRIADWKITAVDTIADNASSARFVVGLEPRRITDVTLAHCRMVMTCNGRIVSEGFGADCFGHPLKSALWLAETMAMEGHPLRAGEVLLTGALGPMHKARAGDLFEVNISGFAPVAIAFE